MVPPTAAPCCRKPWTLSRDLPPQAFAASPPSLGGRQLQHSLLGTPHRRTNKSAAGYVVSSNFAYHTRPVAWNKRLRNRLMDGDTITTLVLTSSTTSWKLETNPAVTIKKEYMPLPLPYKRYALIEHRIITSVFKLSSVTSLHLVRNALVNISHSRSTAARLSGSCCQAQGRIQNPIHPRQRKELSNDNFGRPRISSRQTARCSESTDGRRRKH